jgi:hypothetical protein
MRRIFFGKMIFRMHPDPARVQSDAKMTVTFNNAVEYKPSQHDIAQAINLVQRVSKDQSNLQQTAECRACHPITNNETRKGFKKCT